MKINDKMKAVIKSIFLTAAVLLIVIYPSEAAESTVKSINVCINSIFPSMFAFMVLSEYIQNSGLYRIIFRPALFVFKKIIKADDSIVSVFLLSLFGGYPVGLKLLCGNISQNKNSPAIISISENSAAFCYCISPTFALIMLGSGVLGNTAAGAVIYISDVLACLTMAVIVSHISDPGVHSSELTATGSGLIDAINSASRSLFLICTVIISFNVVISCLTAFITEFGTEVSPMISGIFEISNLLKLRSVPLSLVPVISAIASTGGLCVILQCLAIVKGSFSVKKFLLARIPCALLSGIYTYIILRFTDISVETSSLSANYTYSFSADKIIVLVLIAMCIIIFYKTDKNSKKV